MSRPSLSPNLRSLRNLSEFEEEDLIPFVLAACKVLGFIALLLTLVVGVQSMTGLRFIAAAFIFFFLIQLIWQIPLWGAILTFFFLALLGGIRRWLIFDFGWLSYDPLILISPLIALVCFLQLLVARRVPADTPLSRAIKYLLIIMALQVLNPGQGGLLVGFGGILYYIAPLLWFYVGRRYGNERILLSLFKAAIVILTVTSLYGLKQTFVGLASSEQQWVDTVGRGSMAVSDAALRAFSTFASQQESAMTTSYALCLCIGLVLHKKFQFLPLVVILLPALLFSGTRGPLVFALFAICVQWALIGRSRSVWLPRLALALCIGVAGTLWSLSSINTTTIDASQGDLLRHQQEGLLNPEKSTAPDHINLVLGGVAFSLRRPFGAGLGATTLAAGKLGGGIGGAETDHGNLFISLGIVGGTLYLFVNYLIFKQAIASWTHSRNAVFLLVVGILVNTFGQWLNGGLYSLCFLTWFSVGVMDRYFVTQVQPTQVKEPKASKAPPAFKTRGKLPQRANLRGRGFRGRPQGRALAPGRRRLNPRGL